MIARFLPFSIGFLVACLVSFLAGVMVCWFVSLSANQEKFLIDEVFNLSSAQIQSLKRVEKYLLGDDEDFRDFLFCELKRKEREMNRLVEELRKREVNLERVYGGKMATQLSSEHLFKKAGLKEESYKESWCDSLLTSYK